MREKTLGRTGLKVSELCLGTMTFGGQTAKDDAIEIIKTAFDRGVNFFDCADIYCAGESERILGEALSDIPRDDTVIATKVCGPIGRGMNGRGLSRKHIISAVEGSLKRLGTDYIDLYYIHFPDGNTDDEEYIYTMDNLVRQGKIRYYGISNYPAWRACALLYKAREMNCAAPVVSQSVYNLLTRGLDEEFIPFTQKYGMGLAVYNPLCGGLLTGKHMRDKAEEGSRFDLEKGYRMRYWKDENFDAIDELKTVAADAGIDLTELALKWLCSKDYVDSIIVGVSRLEQLDSDIAYMEKDLPAQDILTRCDDVWNRIKGDYFTYHR